MARTARLEELAKEYHGAGYDRQREILSQVRELRATGTPLRDDRNNVINTIVNTYSMNLLPSANDMAPFLRALVDSVDAHQAHIDMDDAMEDDVFHLAFGEHIPFLFEFAHAAPGMFDPIDLVFAPPSFVQTLDPNLIDMSDRNRDEFYGFLDDTLAVNGNNLEVAMLLFARFEPNVENRLRLILSWDPEIVGSILNEEKVSPDDVFEFFDKTSFDDLLTLQHPDADHGVEGLVRTDNPDTTRLQENIDMMLAYMLLHRRTRETHVGASILDGVIPDGWRQRALALLRRTWDKESLHAEIKRVRPLLPSRRSEGRRSGGRRTTTIFDLSNDVLARLIVHSDRYAEPMCRGGAVQPWFPLRGLEFLLFLRWATEQLVKSKLPWVPLKTLCAVYF